MNFFLKYRLYLFVLAAAFIVSSYQISSFSASSKELALSSFQLSQKIQSLVQEIQNSFTTGYFTSNFAQKKLTKEEVVRLNKLPYEVLLYNSDSLIFWSNNIVIPSLVISSYSQGTALQKFKNGYFVSIKKNFSNRHGKTLTLLALIPLRYDYQISNTYLRNHFGELFKLPSYFEVSSSQQAGYLPVKLRDGSALFFLGINEAERNTQPGIWSLVFFLSGIIALLLFLNHMLNLLPVHEHQWLRPAMLGMIFLCSLLYFANKSWLPDDVENWRIFNPVLFASSSVASSLGALFIQLLFLLWICLHLTNKFRVRISYHNASFYNYLAHTAGYLIIFFMVIYCVYVIQALLHDSKIEFAFINPLAPDYFSILGVLCIALLIFCLFLVADKIIFILKARPLKWLDHAVILMICTMISFGYYIYLSIGLPALLIISWTNIFIFLLLYFRSENIARLNFTRMFVMMVFFAFAGAALLYYFGKEKQKETQLVYAKKLIHDRDAVTEYLLAELRDRISADAFVIQFFNTQQIPGKVLIDRLQQLYFQEGFSRYAIRFYAFDEMGLLLPGWGEDFGFVTEMGITGSLKSIPGYNGQLLYSFSSSGNITYLREYQVKVNDTIRGKLFVELKTNAFKSATVYPELLVTEKDKPPVVTPSYSYAIYNNHRLIDQHGVFNYDYRFRWQLRPSAETQFIDIDESTHLVYAPLSNILIVVTAANNSRIYFLSYFSFLFVVIFTLALLIILFNIFLHHPGLSGLRHLIRSASLRTLIQSFFMIFILIMLIITGYVTGQFFLKQFNELAQSTVKDKMNRITETTQYFLERNLSDTLFTYSLAFLLRSNISQLADIQDNEVNFYDRSGDLLASSQPSIFEKGIIGRKINPVAFYELKKETQTAPLNEEHIGKLTYYSGYQAVRNTHGRLICFVNLPYYNSRQQLNEQVGFFFVTLVNILVLAIVIAGLMAPFISQQITSKLSVISDKFRKLRIGASNELIDWHADDEIGSLVKEYNKMINELEKSTLELSRSQRELAWREMAQQVAHEIKNPLTPMKLSIQHLRRAYENNSPNLPQLVASVSKTLIEQIDNLSGIATEFSNFAKMPRPEIGKVNVHDVLLSSAELHNEFANAHIHLHTNAENNMVSSDKNQLLSVFNNLILNAIQSIPSDRMGEINIITENDDGQLIISVNDNGAGISVEEKEKVFTPNFTTKSSGTGLGLALSKNIIESFGGSISFNSQKDIGTTFFVHLPLHNSSSLS
ncbi:MAG: HAMP domain-containing sensor histidine kinase [Chitinophagales bacterium]